METQICDSSGLFSQVLADDIYANHRYRFIVRGPLDDRTWPKLYSVSVHLLLIIGPINKNSPTTRLIECGAGKSPIIVQDPTQGPEVNNRL